MVVIEAAAIGLPAVASRIYGLIDAVEEECTGILHTPGAVDEIAIAIQRLASDKALREQMGQAGKARVEAKFSEVCLANAFIDFYKQRFSEVFTSVEV